MSQELLGEISIDSSLSSRDQELLRIFYAASLSEGGSADEVTLRCIRAIVDWQLEQVIDAWESTVQSDLENGVKWLNEQAAKELASKYPRIFAFGQELAEMRPQQQQETD